jgi:hypothetical protein
MPAIVIECPDCGSRLRMSSAVEPSKKVRCPKCGVAFAPRPQGGGGPRAARDRDTAMERESPRRTRSDDFEERPASRRTPPRPPRDEDEDDRRGAPPPVPRRRAARDDYDDDEDDRPRRRRRKQEGMNPVLLWSMVGVIAFLVLGGSGAAAYFLIMKDKTTDPAGEAQGGGGGGGARQRSDWEPDPAMLGQLAPEATVASYRIQPPQGYTKRSQNLPGGHVYFWQGPPRGDGTFPALAVTVVTEPRGPVPELKTIIAPAMSGMKSTQVKIFQDWAYTEPEYGEIAGIRFARLRLSGTQKMSGQKMKGVCYIGLEGRSMILMATQVLEPNVEETLKLLDASMLTLTKGAGQK